jgi:hypothetical protein
LPHPTGDVHCRISSKDQQQGSAARIGKRIAIPGKSRIRTRKREQAMKNVLWMMGGFCAAATGFLVWNCKCAPPVELLAHRLEQAWADHHTVV